MTASLLFVALNSLLIADAWRSELYPRDWEPPGEEKAFYTDKIIQDFSYAGYRRGEASIPNLVGPIFDVVADFNADPTGARSSTQAIQAAIDAAEAAGGGVVYLPAGTFKVSPGSRSAALRVNRSGVVIRGAGPGVTFLFNDSTQMRKKRVIDFDGSVSKGPVIALTGDLPSPTRFIPVSDTSALNVGDFVFIGFKFNNPWIAEHGQQEWWNESDGAPADGGYYREILRIDHDAKVLEIDIPTRYSLFMRHGAYITRLTGVLHTVGVENLSIGNREIPEEGTSHSDWNENAHRDSSKPAYHTHGSFFIEINDARDGWIRNVHSYQPAVNQTPVHVLSNGIKISRSFRITLQNCLLQNPQFGGGGGNGYLYRLSGSGDNLIKNCEARRSRHGLVVSGASTTGNVFFKCIDRFTATQVAGNGRTNGSNSDSHQHFSHSNLFDQCVAEESAWEAKHRGPWGSIKHALTAAHQVYWNMRGEGSRGILVRSEQGRYGYIIGTSGTRHGVKNGTPGNTAPADHVEGVNDGADLIPASLYLDQFAKRSSGF
ncbi:MAG: glycosyl hydrolase family 28-related protein [Opitutales bacterium]